MGKYGEKDYHQVTDEVEADWDLTGGARRLPERQQTIHGTIARSYELLDETEKKLQW